MRLLISYIFLLVTVNVFTQQWTDVGVNLGLSFYNGDLNESKLFYKPSFSRGVLFKFNLDTRYSVKFAVKNCNLNGSDSDFNNPYQNSRRNSFQIKVWDVVLQTEFNFLPYNPLDIGKDFISPYVTAGIGGSLINTSTPIFVLPFGIGLKQKINRRIGIAGEWTFRKTFYDSIDETTNVISGDKRSFIHNNDWYSFFGFIVTYNISKLRIECPAYD